MFQISIGVIALVASLFKVNLSSWGSSLSLVGVVWFLIGIAMYRIRHGIRSNAVPLKTAGQAIGDLNLSIPKKIAFTDMLACVIIFLGAVSLILGVLFLVCPI